jgi:hypothetical protein
MSSVADDSFLLGERQATELRLRDPMVEEAMGVLRLAASQSAWPLRSVEPTVANAGSVESAHEAGAQKSLSSEHVCLQVEQDEQCCGVGGSADSPEFFSRLTPDGLEEVNQDAKGLMLMQIMEEEPGFKVLGQGISEDVSVQQPVGPSLPSPTDSVTSRGPCDTLAGGLPGAGPEEDIGAQHSAEASAEQA